MSMFYPGFEKARELVRKKMHEERLEYIDGLFGRDNIEDQDDEQEVLTEALAQCKREFTDTSSNEYSIVQSMLKGRPHGHR